MNITITQNQVDSRGLLDHFIKCNTEIINVNLRLHAEKLRKFATTIEIWYDEELVGLCACYMNNIESGVSFISHIAIHPGFKRIGLGKKIIDTTIQGARLKGFQKLQLEVSKENSAAIAFYTKQKFVIIEDRESKFLMSLDL